ncbi:MAG: DNA-directed RNA polymerase subunit beta [Chloroflexi bacterium]|nr:DNA-directed RNA polymerase subunit beta [Chloroflexota bacterium]
MNSTHFLSNTTNHSQRKSYSRIPEVLDVPSLIKIQTDSFRQFIEEGLRELFDEISPIQDFTGDRFELRFRDYEFREPKYSETECRERDMTYDAPLFVNVQLIIKKTGEIKEQSLFMGDIPMMTAQGTFIINGAERVVVSQLVRSPGVYFTLEHDPISDRKLCYAKLIPSRGAWLEFETSSKNVISAKIDRKRKLPVTTLLRAVGYGTDQELLSLFQDIDGGNQNYMKTTIEREPTVTSQEEAMINLYRRLRPGEPHTVENAAALLDALFFNFRRYDLGKVGRYKMNKRFGLEVPEEIKREDRVLRKEDLVAIVRQVILVNNGKDSSDDIDHLGNRRIRGVGELIQNQFRIGLLRMERVVRERMTLIDPETATPSALINIRPIVASIREFFGGSQLSQFMDQTNPLAELTHKRRLSALGPGGLSRERAGFDVRDVHHSHYGRICPIETPEGPNIGLLGSLATFAVVNKYGFIETPYRKVVKEVPNTAPTLLGKTLRESVMTAKGELVAEVGTVVTPELARRLTRLSSKTIKVKPFVSDDIEYLSADKEEKFVIVQANAPLDEKNQFIDEKVEVRLGEKFLMENPENVDFMDVAPKQIVSVSTSLIPFLEHDDANRALMGSNMQRQAVPLLRPESPLVGTGMERKVAQDSGQVVLSTVDGVVASSTGREIVVVDEEGKEQVHTLMKFVRSNQGTCIHQRPMVNKGDVVKKGQPLADSSSTELGELALGQNVLCAFMSWEGYNFEDAIVISESLVRSDKFTSIHIEKYEVEARDTKLGPEEITRDIPNVGEESLRDLDEFGIIRIGAEVGPGDILVGKITPKGETELTAEEKLLRAIFGEKAREVKDTSLRVPHGERGKVIDVKVFTRDNHSDLHPGVNQLVRVWIAQTRKISVGDKMAGRHGNKGVIARVLPPEDMPYLPDGTPVEIILNPIGVPSRMNLGQILEAHLGLAASVFNFKALSPVFDGADRLSIEDALARVWVTQRAAAIDPALSDGAPRIEEEKLGSWLSERGYNLDKLLSDKHPTAAKEMSLRIWLQDMGVDTKELSLEQMDAEAKRIHQEKKMAPPYFGKTVLYDGRTGESFDQPVTVGSIYMMKLIHLVEDKVHARSTGPYSLITQQPLGGKAQFGGQRFGEMEVWALEAYSAAYNLQETLTVKSDDVAGRVKTYEAIVKGEDVFEPGVPESFRVLQKELQSLGLAVELLNEEEERVPLAEESEEEPLPELEKDR